MAANAWERMLIAAAEDGELARNQFLMAWWRLGQMQGICPADESFEQWKSRAEAAYAEELETVTPPTSEETPNG